MYTAYEPLLFRNDCDEFSWFKYWLNGQTSEAHSKLHPWKKSTAIKKKCISSFLKCICSGAFPFLEKLQFHASRSCSSKHDLSSFPRCFFISCLNILFERLTEYVHKYKTVCKTACNSWEYHFKIFSVAHLSVMYRWPKHRNYYIQPIHILGHNRGVN